MWESGIPLCLDQTSNEGKLGKNAQNRQLEMNKNSAFFQLTISADRLKGGCSLQNARTSPRPGISWTVYVPSWQIGCRTWSWLVQLYVHLSFFSNTQETVRQCIKIAETIRLQVESMAWLVPLWRYALLYWVSTACRGWFPWAQRRSLAYHCRNQERQVWLLKLLLHCFPLLRNMAAG